MPHDREFNSLMLDYYGDLLTKHQKDILDEYFNEDLSMNEIAENYEISKSAVQDLIKRTLIQLETYEKHLKMIDRDKKLDDVLEQMRTENNQLLDKYIARIEKVK